MKHWIAAIFISMAAPLSAATPAAIFTDPAPDKTNPAKMETVHIPSGGVDYFGELFWGHWGTILGELFWGHNTNNYFILGTQY